MAKPEIIKTASSYREVTRVKPHRSQKQVGVVGRFRIYRDDQYGKRQKLSTAADYASALDAVRSLVYADVEQCLMAKSEDRRLQLNKMYQTALDAVELNFNPRRSKFYFTLLVSGNVYTYCLEEILS